MSSGQSVPSNPLREKFVEAVMSRRDCDREEAEVIMARIADRLDGYSHTEAKARNPLPEEES